MEETFQKIEEQISQAIYPGASLAYFQKGKWQEAYFGTQDGSEPVKAGLIYDLASVSKVVGVGTLLILAYQSGQLDLDASLKSYYPAVENEKLTIRDLLTHASGIDPFIPNRDQLNQEELIAAINKITVKEEKDFLYTDINFILLGLMLEYQNKQTLDQLFQDKIFGPWQMTETSFGPREMAVPTVKGQKAGLVHDPKARVLGVHTGSAGLFSNLRDLERFVNHYLTDDFAEDLVKNYSYSSKERSLAWDLQDDWLLHTGYTGTFILINIPQQSAAIFLSNRTYEKDERAQWILDRNELIEIIKKDLLA
ncbi:serine hydrolase domain-containing protein [Streptococcus loxodontisalivarius]